MSYSSFLITLRNILASGLIALAISTAAYSQNRGIWPEDSRQQFLMMKRGLAQMEKGLEVLVNTPPRDKKEIKAQTKQIKRRERRIAWLKRKISSLTAEYDLDENGYQRPLHPPTADAAAPTEPPAAPETRDHSAEPATDKAPDIPASVEESMVDVSYGRKDSAAMRLDFNIAYRFANGSRREGDLGLSAAASYKFALKCEELDSRPLRNWIQKYSRAIQVADQRGLTIEKQVFNSTSRAVFLVRDKAGNPKELQISQDFKFSDYSLWSKNGIPQATYTLGDRGLWDTTSEAACLAEHLRGLAEKLGNQAN